MVDEAVRKFLSEIGRKGGKKSHRTLTSKQAKEMVKAREEKRKRNKKKEKVTNAGPS
jgi:general stress protein YciG